ncbi:hypothetical protein AB0J47_39835 [Nocardia sp. NPDC049737]|uniref:hypothetical protein n=1 Tax=Nocardia sp. NPDC049737 TaxID=3154358 RepID=UPI00341A9F04
MSAPNGDRVEAPPTPSIGHTEAEELLSRMDHATPLEMDRLEQWTQWQGFER